MKPGRWPDIHEHVTLYENAQKAEANADSIGKGEVIASTGPTATVQDIKGATATVDWRTAHYVIDEEGGDIGDPIEWENFQQRKFVARYDDIRANIETQKQTIERQLRDATAQLAALRADHSGLTTATATEKAQTAANIKHLEELVVVLKRHLVETREKANEYESLFAPATGGGGSAASAASEPKKRKPTSKAAQ